MRLKKLKSLFLFFLSFLIFFNFFTFSNAISKNRSILLKDIDVNSSTINNLKHPKANAIAKNKQEFTDILIYRLKNAYAGTFSIAISKKSFRNFKEFEDFISELLKESYYNPEVYDILPNNSYYTIESSKNYVLKIEKPSYFYKKSDLASLNSFIKKWVSENINSSMTEEEKVRAIHDYMVYQYVYSYGDNGQKDESSPVEDSVRNGYFVSTSFALVFTGGGVCNAHAILFFRMAKQSGLEVKYVIGRIEDKDLHAWNMVKVDGNWYHIDVTHDRRIEIEQHISTEEFKRYGLDYCLVSDDKMKEDRTWDYSLFPKAEKNYYNNIADFNFSDY
ncbi:transglutaminase domain-containing protein [Peptoanaerobacter stomatis]|uniref:transglutaminase domain-containing protein n=1 Tax=Peptoanaerobacter stomatis TaxID=796937 RepID=UPI003F9FFA5D